VPEFNVIACSRASVIFLVYTVLSVSDGQGVVEMVSHQIDRKARDPVLGFEPARLKAIEKAKRRAPTGHGGKFATMFLPDGRQIAPSDLVANLGNNLLDTTSLLSHTRSMETPKTLQAAIRQFSDEDAAVRHFASKRWPDGVACPYCGTKEPYPVPSRRIWKCRLSSCRKQFSVKVGTIFEESPLPLSKWLAALWMIANCKNGVSSYEIHRGIGVTQKSAWFMLHRIRLGMQDKATGGKLSGDVEADESFIGGKARFMHKSRKLERRGGRAKAPGPDGKAIVAAVLERGGKVRATVVPRRQKKQLQKFLRENVEAGSSLYTDDLQSYDGLKADYLHQVIDHAEAYVDGQVHTNGLENFWSLLQRGLKGTYVSVEPFHLFRYVDEQAYRFNNRTETDAERFDRVCQMVVGRRVTWDRLTGKTAETADA
jgi:transposase-like protein